MASALAGNSSPQTRHVPAYRKPHPLFARRRRLAHARDRSRQSQSWVRALPKRTLLFPDGVELA